jgi:hypothetical protein
MPHLLTRMPKVFALAASAALGAFLFAESGPAEAAPRVSLNGLATSAAPVEQVGYYRRDYRSYGYGPSQYSDNYGSYGYRSYGDGHDEIRALQRLFPSTNWPYSMRYYSE